MTCRTNTTRYRISIRRESETTKTLTIKLGYSSKGSSSSTKSGWETQLCRTRSRAKAISMPEWTRLTSKRRNNSRIQTRSCLSIHLGQITPAKTQIWSVSQKFPDRGRKTYSSPKTPTTRQLPIATTSTITITSTMIQMRSNTSRCSSPRTKPTTSSRLSRHPRKRMHASGIRNWMTYLSWEIRGKRTHSKSSRDYMSNNSSIIITSKARIQPTAIRGCKSKTISNTTKCDSSCEIRFQRADWIFRNAKGMSDQTLEVEEQEICAITCHIYLNYLNLDLCCCCC